ncbi:MAG: glycerol-3-phosphate dehydrogenase/oxidase [Bacteroidota bacterium]
MNRDFSIQQIQTTSQWDIIIIGGGATGLGCAVDAANRGYKTLLLEKYDFAKGTSSRATKLVHGGVRYLAQGNIRLVREALQERGRLLKNAPHVCHRLAFVVPFYNNFQKWYYWFGLWLYEFLSGKLSLGKTKFLSKKGTLRNLPGLAADNLTGGVLYFDGQFDDSRLAINLAQTATEQGATVINYFGVTGFTKENEKIKGVIAKDELNGHTFSLNAKVIINATGVFADELLQMAEGYKEQTITPSQGIHLVVDKKFFAGIAGLMVPKTDDGRVLFAIPWHDKLLLGTTDTPVEKISTEPMALQEEIDFVVSHFNRYAAAEINYADVQSVFVGLRPLVRSGNKKKTAVMPRDHHIEVLPSGLIHITGGKWTTYRSMAEHAIDKATKAAGLRDTDCNTGDLPLHGYTNTKKTSHLSIYGSDALMIEKMIEEDISLAQKIHPLYPYTKAEINWFIQNEMAITVEDILARRIRLLFLDAKAAMEAAPAVATFMAKELNKDEQWIAQQLINFKTLAKGYTINLKPQTLN